jgi:hypothetical protein
MHWCKERCTHPLGDVHFYSPSHFQHSMPSRQTRCHWDWEIMCDHHMSVQEHRDWREIWPDTLQFHTCLHCCGASGTGSTPHCSHYHIPSPDSHTLLSTMTSISAAALSVMVRKHHLVVLLLRVGSVSQQTINSYCTFHMTWHMWHLVTNLR